MKNLLQLLARKIAPVTEKDVREFLEAEVRSMPQEAAAIEITCRKNIFLISPYWVIWAYTPTKRVSRTSIAEAKADLTALEVKQ